MKTSNATIGSILAAIIWADGEYSDVERTTIGEIAEALGLTEKELTMNVTAALVELKNMDEAKATEFAVKHAAKVDEEEIGEVFQALLQMEFRKVGKMRVVADLLTFFQLQTEHQQIFFPGLQQIL